MLVPASSRGRTTVALAGSAGSSPTGGIIIAEKSRDEIETIIEEDPFVAKGLAELRIVEFRASQRADDIQLRIAGDSTT